MRLNRAFFDRNTAIVARHLLGKIVVRKMGTETQSAVITETEAYHGPHDAASHASRGMTPRTRIMFGPAGYTYVYLIYGMYHCLNVTTMREGFPAAVLIRAISGASWPPERTNGPGKLCRVLDITKSQDALPLGNDELWFEDRGVRVPRSAVIAYPRVGIAYAAEPWRSRPWRFVYTRQGN